MIITIMIRIIGTILVVISHNHRISTFVTIIVTVAVAIIVVIIVTIVFVSSVTLIGTDNIVLEVDWIAGDDDREPVETQKPQAHFCGSL